MATTKRSQVLAATHYLNRIDEMNLVLSKFRTGDYQELLSALKSSAEVIPEEVLGVLKLVETCLHRDIHNIPHALTMMLSMFTKKKCLKALSEVPTDKLLKSALAILSFVKTLSATETNLRIMGMQVVLSYPLKVLTMVVTSNYSDLLEMFDNFTPEILQGVHDKLYIFLQELLMNLPAQEKELFVREGLSRWFCIIDIIMKECAIVKDNDAALNYVGCIEILTAALEEVEYNNCPKWIMVHENIIVTKSYPNAINKLLKDGSENWHKYWIGLVKLLKKEMRQSCIKIQPMLTVVENAFKMDSTTRCRAFKCWDELIDCANESNPIPKFFKLLLIPLTLYNAKTSESVQAKFYTWWSLVKKFESKLDNFPGDTLLEFIRFMFGRKALDKKNVPQDIVVGVGQTYPNVQSLCLQAFAEITGHEIGCDCDTSLRKLNESLLNYKRLTSHWDDWINALKTAILITNKIHNTDSRQIGKKPMEVLCIWRAYMVLIAELPANGVRKDMFNELIQVLVDLFQTYKTSETLPDILFSLTLSLTEDNDSVRKLLKASIADEQPLRKIITLIVSPRMDEAFKRRGTSEMIDMLTPLSDLAVEAINTHCCLDYLGHNSNSLIFWTALIHSVNESQRFVCTKTLKQMLAWPFLVMQQVEVERSSATAWQTLYNSYMKKSSNIEFDIEISKHIQSYENNPYFKTIVAVCVLKNRLLNSHKDVGVFSCMLENITAESVSKYKTYEQIVPVLVDTASIMLEKVSAVTDLAFAKVTFNCVKNIITMCLLELRSQEDKDSCSNIFIMLDAVFKGLQPISKMPTYAQIFCELLEFLRDFVIPSDTSILELILSKLNYLRLNNPNELVEAKINESYKMLEKKFNVAENDSNKNKTKEFTSPSVKKVKKSRKSKPEVVGTVTENGEEYVVVNSNWHPRLSKMTENQKEKLQGPRQPLPSMYQDLSQSQDEFKKSMWKTDSQDETTETSSVSSNISKSNITSNILKDVSFTDIVPNIMQNLLPKNDKDNTKALSEKVDVNTAPCSPSTPKNSPSTPKNNKSRMSIKDRVNRNFQNLIKKGTPNKDVTHAIVHDNQLAKTPIKRIPPNVNASNSAPTLSTHRPSRVKRVPKKLEDSKLFSLKRRRNSLTDSHSENETEFSDDSCKDKDGENKEVIKKKNSKMTKPQPKINHGDVSQPKTILIQDSPELTELETTRTKDSLDEITTENQSNNSDEHGQESSEIQPETPDSQNDHLDNTTQDSPKNNQPTKDKNQTTDEKASKGLNKVKDNKDTEMETTRTPVRKTKVTRHKTTTKKSRIEKELAIDMVEGHPFLKVQSEKRLTRKKLMTTENVGRRKSVPAKLSKPKAQKPKANGLSQESVTIEEKQEGHTFSEDIPCSEDIIESSQDSTFTTISVQSSKRTPKRQPVVSVEKLQEADPKPMDTQELLNVLSQCDSSNVSSNKETNDDIELPINKTLVEENQNSTADMDTQPIDCMIIDDQPHVNKITDSQVFADADTQRINSTEFAEFEPDKTLTQPKTQDPIACQQEVIEPATIQRDFSETDTASSPCKGDEERNLIFLNDTSAISPIKKTQISSDEAIPTTPSPEKNEEYVVVKLATPVQSNGEPYSSKGSPEFFTEDKSDEKREQSPPRSETTSSVGSPTTTLSLKKNRPQAMRPSGRSALMVELCVPDSLSAKNNTEKPELERPKKANTSTPATRAIKIFNMCGMNDDTDDNDPDFLKFDKALPSADSSPIGPILKRKMATMEDTLISPACKRKRVSFLDPPVSTSKNVQKYIIPPYHVGSSSKTPRGTKSKTNENTINKLDRVMSKAIKSFVDQPDSLSQTSLEITPAVEIVVTSELNDTDPICADLINCEDSIENIAEQLSSPATKDFVLKELGPTVSTVGDLAKMTELEVNRLCIKSPKVQVVKKALNDYFSKNKIAVLEDPPEPMAVVLETDFVEEVTDVEEPSTSEVGCQTRTEMVTCSSAQTDGTSTKDVDAQTSLSSFGTTSEIIGCISQREDFVEKLAADLPVDTIFDIVKKKSEVLSTNVILNKLFDHQNQELSEEERTEKELLELQQFCLQRLNLKDVLLFGSKLLEGLRAST